MIRLLKLNIQIKNVPILYNKKVVKKNIMKSFTLNITYPKLLTFTPNFLVSNILHYISYTYYNYTCRLKKKKNSLDLIGELYLPNNNIYNINITLLIFLQRHQPV